MSSMHRTIEGEVVVQHLSRDEWMIEPSLLARHGRTARTLVKEGPLRLTVIAVAAGGEIPVHKAEGPISVHVLEGEILFDTLGREYQLNTGDVLVLVPGAEHSVRSSAGGVFLLTLVHAPAASSSLGGSGVGTTDS